jgi:excisionase family DNA binding protein
MGERQYLSRSEVAKMFQVSPSTITRWADEGKLPYVKTLGGHRRYEVGAIEAIVKGLVRQRAGEEASRMEKTCFEVPSMYADHHVIAVRDALLSLDGVTDVYASSAWQQVFVSYDPEKTTPQVVEKALRESGYPPGEMPPLPAPRGKREKDMAWETLGFRAAKTNQVDIEMSGEFRKY